MAHLTPKESTVGKHSKPGCGLFVLALVVSLALIVVPPVAVIWA